MTLLNRSALPKEIKRNGKTYKMDMDLTTAVREGRSAAMETELKGCLLVQVLSHNLRGRTDLRGRAYQPTKWVFRAMYGTKRYVPYGINGEYFVYDNELGHIPVGRGTGGTKKKIQAICDKLNAEEKAPTNSTTL